MFAITFDLVVADIKRHNRKAVSAAYSEVGRTLSQYGFRWIQGSVYVTDNDDMANMMTAILALRNLTWFQQSGRDIRGFRVENWSDFTPIATGRRPDTEN